MRKSSILLAIATLGASVPAFSTEDFSYTYAEVGYINSESGGRDGDGVNLFGSLRLADMLHAFASYSEQEFDGNLNVDFFQAGVGLSLPIASKLDFVGRLSYVQVDVDGPGFSTVEDNGYAFNFSLRTRVIRISIWAAKILRSMPARDTSSPAISRSAWTFFRTTATPPPSWVCGSISQATETARAQALIAAPA
jgi:hypothetical protein